MFRKFLVILILGIVVFLSVFGPQIATPILLNMGVIDGVKAYILTAGFAFITNASIFVPVYNATPIIVDIADHNTLWIVAGVYGFASAIGESTSYFVGKKAINKIPGFEKSEIHKFFVEFMSGPKTKWIIFLAALLPTPFDVGGIVAGNIGFPLKWFIGLTFAGRWIKWFILLLAWDFFENLISQIPFIGGSAEAIMLTASLLLIVIFMWIPLKKRLKGHWNGNSKELK